METKRWQIGRACAVAFGACGLFVGLISCGGGGGGGSSTALSTTSGTTGTTTSGTTGGGTSQPLTKVQLGKALFFDANLSNPPGVACATCHSPAKAFSDPRPGFPTSQGAVKGLFGPRNAPSVSYMAFSPTFSVSSGGNGVAIGGQFWDGRAADLPTQAKSPLLNPIEMNNASAAAVVATVQKEPFASSVQSVYGASIFSNTNNAFNAIVDAISAFERSPEVSPFSSKFDAFLNGTAQLSASEVRGLALFNGQGNCASCHSTSASADGTPPLLTSYCYANFGLPKNAANPFYTIPAKFNPAGSAYIDHGLMVTTGRPQDDGQFMTPSLRNVAVTGPYFHNGIFSSLTQVLNFYNSRNLGGFGNPEVPATVDQVDLGNLGLTAQDQSDIIAFLGTLTDGYTTPALQVLSKSTLKR